MFPFSLIAPGRLPAPAFRSPTENMIISTCSTSAMAASAASSSSIEECETGYDTKKGVECYEQVKDKKPVIVNPWSTGITLQLIPKAGGRQDSGALDGLWAFGGGGRR